MTEFIDFHVNLAPKQHVPEIKSSLKQLRSSKSFENLLIEPKSAKRSKQIRLKTIENENMHAPGLVHDISIDHFGEESSITLGEFQENDADNDSPSNLVEPQNDPILTKYEDNPNKTPLLLLNLNSKLNEDKELIQEEIKRLKKREMLKKSGLAPLSGKKGKKSSMFSFKKRKYFQRSDTFADSPTKSPFLSSPETSPLRGKGSKRRVFPEEGGEIFNFEDNMSRVACLWRKARSIYDGNLRKKK